MSYRVIGGVVAVLYEAVDTSNCSKHKTRWTIYSFVVEKLAHSVLFQN